MINLVPDTRWNRWEMNAKNKIIPKNKVKHPDPRYEGLMDIECISLCEALNKIPGIETIESCCGHGNGKYQIWFKCYDLHKLSYLLYFIDPCHVDFSNWRCRVKTDFRMSYPTFVLEGTGPLAYKQSELIAKYIEDYLPSSKFKNKEKEMEKRKTDLLKTSNLTKELKKETDCIILSVDKIKEILNNESAGTWIDNKIKPFPIEVDGEYLIITDIGCIEAISIWGKKILHMMNNGKLYDIPIGYTLDIKYWLKIVYSKNMYE